MRNRKKITIYQENKKWNGIFQSVVVDGFWDNNDQVRMHQNKVIIEDEDIDQMVENDAKYSPTVSEYLRNVIHPILGQKMFDHVYPTILGKREFIILVDEYGDIENYLEVVTGELAREMTPVNRACEFLDLVTVENVMDGPKWKPFHQKVDIVKTVQEYNGKSKNFNKWSRIYNANKHYYQHNTTVQATTITPTNNKVVPTNIGNSYARVTTGTNLVPVVENTSPKFGVFQDMNVMKTNITVLEETVKKLEVKMANLHSESIAKIELTVKSINKISMQEINTNLSMIMDALEKKGITISSRFTGKQQKQ
jgi:hypothetical protein